MSKINELNKIIFDDKVILFWEKIYGMNEIFNYQIFLNDNLVGETKKTHFTLNKLEVGTSYYVIIKVILNETEIVELTEKIEIKTQNKKEFIDISKAPYNAVGDGKTLNTSVIQKAINDCKANQYVYIPEGKFLTGALKLHSDMGLYLHDNAILQGTDNPKDYLPMIKSRFEGIERTCYSSLLNLGELDSKSGFNCSNVVIRGKGVIASGGWSLAKTIIDQENIKLQDYLKELGSKINEYEKTDTIAGRVRPRLINISNGENVVMDGITFKDGASWNIHMVYSNNIITHDCFVYSKGIWNGDGWDPDSSTNCTIFNCQFDTADDAIAIKSGKNPEGNEINKPTEHIKIFDVKLVHGHGIAIGSEMSGGINDIKMWDCDLEHSLYGFEIKATKKRGGYVSNVYVKDVVVPRVHMHSVLYNDDGVGAESVPKFSECNFEDVVITGRYHDYDGQIKTCDAIEIIGFDEKNKIKNITFKNVKLLGNQKITLELCENIKLENISCSNYDDFRFFYN